MRDRYTKKIRQKKLFLIKDVIKVDLSPLIKCYASLRVGDGQERRCMTPVRNFFEYNRLHRSKRGLAISYLK